ncbi:uncharacterized protein [Neodiprion pinetum]|uniref:uncharacterized protein n=1 Tax=Neodiprion pinetum TaxID=441929 RepID=UPI001EDD60F2|nr:uncharacterized protein LOC124224754 [Neodiprion pinetum]
MAETDSLAQPSRLFVKDRPTGTQFLVDTGSDLSIIPPGGAPARKARTGYQLRAANGSPIDTFGWTTMTLDLSLRRDLSWRFVVADVTRPLIGADFPSHFGTAVDLKGRRLIDTTTTLTSLGSIAHIDHASVKVIACDNSPQFEKIIAEFPDIVKPDGAVRDVKHNTCHYIKTSSLE